MKLTMRAVAAAGLGLLAAQGQAQTTSFDAVAQFSLTKNTATSHWSYRYNTTGTRDGNYTLMPSSSPSGTQWYKGTTPVAVSIWTQSGPGTSANIAANKRGAALTTNFCCGTVTWAKHSLYMNPAEPGDDVVSFLAPRSGAVTITYSFTDMDPYGGNGIRWYVDLNAGTTADLASGALDSTSAASLATTGVQTINISVHKGDRVNFIVDSNGDAAFDSTAVTATVAY